MVDVAMGVVLVVVMVAVVVQVGEQELDEKEAEAPAGRPEAVKATTVEVPEAKVEVMVLVAEDPWATVFDPLLDSVKSKGGAWVVAEADVD